MLSLQALEPTAANILCTLVVDGGFKGCDRVNAYAGLGTQPERALGRWGRRECDVQFEHKDVLRPLWVRVPLLSQIDGQTDDQENVAAARIDEDALIPVILPWDIAHAVAVAGDPCWEAAFYDAAEDGTTAEEYWSLAVTQEWGLLHPITDVPQSEWRSVIPFWIHCDDVQITEGSGAPTPHTVYSWSSALTTGSTQTTKFYLMSWPTHRTCDKTLDAVVGVIKWMVDVLSTGQRPHVGPDGSALRDGGAPYANGFKFMLSGTKHDMAARKETHSDVRVPQSNYCCPLCMASKVVKELSHKDYRPDAPVWKTLVTHESYVASMGGSRWLAVKGFSYLRAQLDEMHCFYFNGIISDLVGSVLLELVFEGAFGPVEDLPGTVDDHLRVATGRFQYWKRNQTMLPWASRHSMKVLTQRRLKWKNWKTYPSTTMTYKCHHIKLMIFWLGDLLSKRANRSEYEHVRALCVCSFVYYVQILERGRAVLSDAERERAHRAGLGFILRYQWLALWNLRAGYALYKQRPKAHSAAHLIHELSTPGPAYNARFAACWLEEDLLGNGDQSHVKLRRA